MAKVCEDGWIESTQGLTYEAVLNSLPALLDAIAHLLSDPAPSDIHTAIDKANVHGELQANQGYNAGEIVREYSVLRNVIFDALEEKLLATLLLSGGRGAKAGKQYGIRAGDRPPDDKTCSRAAFTSPLNQT